jgi:N-acetylmuramoyl-L-alanine amidase CwlA
LSCELCINADINEPQSRRNAEILAAELMNAMGINSLKKHQDCAGKFCPQDMLGDGYWPRFVQRVSELRRERG